MSRNSLLLVAIVAVSLLGGCGDGATESENEASSFTVNYEVIMNSVGAVKVSYKDPAGAVIVEDPVQADAVGTTWTKQYKAEGMVDALLTVELPESAPPDPVGIEMFIAINGERVQKATKFITKQKGMTLTATRP